MDGTRSGEGVPRFGSGDGTIRKAAVRILAVIALGLLLVVAWVIVAAVVAQQPGAGAVPNPTAPAPPRGVAGPGPTDIQPLNDPQ